MKRTVFFLGVLIFMLTGCALDSIQKYGNKLEDEPTGELIRIGDRTKSSVIDDTVEEGDLVAVSGRIDASWCKFYKQLYIECMQLELRDK